MGVQGLGKLIEDTTEGAYTEHDIGDFTSRVIAIDASVCIYQFLVAIRQADGTQLHSETGEITSHIQGMMSRTVRLLKAGIRPVFVFDGKPPEQKSGELEKRRELKRKAEEQAMIAAAEGRQEEAAALARRTVSMTQTHIDDCKRLLTLMGIPVVQAPCEAESQAVSLCRDGRCWAVASQDYDTLTLGCPIYLRNLIMSAKEAKMRKVVQYNLEDLLTALQLEMPAFVDLCILCGCDFATTLPGIGPHSALQLMRQFGSIDKLMEDFDTRARNGTLPKRLQGFDFDTFDYKGARKMFLDPEVTPSAEIPEFRWVQPDAEGLRQFLVTEKGFDSMKVETMITSVRDFLKRPAQGLLDSFFTIKRVSAVKPAPKTREMKTSNVSRNVAKKANKSMELAAKRSSTGRKAQSSVMQRRAMASALSQVSFSDDSAASPTAVEAPGSPSAWDDSED